MGRVIKVGEVKAKDTITNAVTSDRDDFFDWLSNANSIRRQVTRTFYDKQYDMFNTVVLVQNNLRNRVASVIYVENDSLSSVDYSDWLYNQVYDSSYYNSALHYSYNIHGNVDTLTYDVPWLQRHDARYKITTYTYDLISGKVNKVSYQPGATDCFYHKYEYDGDNRLVSAYTSRNGWVWDEDARYNYYLHGPLMRTEIGEDKVQGIDYAYTLQGWLKGVNSSTMTDSLDMSKDGYSGPCANFVRDAFGYSIDYFRDSTSGVFDYLPIGRKLSGFKDFEAWRGTSDLNDAARNLYNGNISFLTTAVPDVDDLSSGTITASPHVRHFHYDKLNRIKRQQGAAINSTTKVWDNKDQKYFANYSYDYNGNLLSLHRKDNESVIMDSLAYTYFNSAADYYNGQPINRLSSVTDNAGATAYELDFEGTSNYEYDAIGNLISDSSDSIASIEWNTYGKVTKVTREEDCEKPDLEFWYDPMGNRLCKIVKPRDGNGATNQNFWTFTWYIRDAQGNIMATYNETHFADNDDYYACLTASEMPMYGSSRLGVQKVYDTLSVIQYVNQTFDADSFYTSVYENIPITLPDANHVAYHPLYKQYEFSNHLGNVLVTVSARPRLIYDVNDDFLYKEADVMSVSDYFPFGMLAPGRHWQSDSYRFGFNGKEKITDWDGKMGTYDFDARLYNVLTARWMSVDPLFKEYIPISPFAYGLNNPLYFLDIDGQKIVDSRGNVVTVSISKAKDGTISATYSYADGSAVNDKYFNENGLIIINEMVQTRTGWNQVEKMIKNELDIRMHLDGSEIGEKDVLGREQPTNSLGYLKPSTNKNGELEGLDIVIYAKKHEAMTSNGGIGNRKGLTKMQSIGVTGSHEAEHTESKNLWLNIINSTSIINNNKNDQILGVETQPERIEREHILDIKLNTKPIN